MICFNANVLPDKNATQTTATGMYNFLCITPEENDEIISILKSAAAYPPEQRGIALAFCSEAVIYKPRYILNQIIIEYAKLSGSPLDTAAEFIALSRKSSHFRGKAIEVFEQIPKNITFPLSPYNNGLTMYSWCGLYLTVSELYEKEYQFDKALEAIEKSRELGWDSAACTKIHAEILTKVDINMAVEYLQSCIAADPRLSNLRATLDEYKAKADKGYKFKPRKSTREDNVEMEQQIRQLAFRYLKRE